MVYTRYKPDPNKPHPEIDADWLEGSHLQDPGIVARMEARLRMTLPDMDGDGYREVPKDWLMNQYKPTGAMPLTPFFRDSPSYCEDRLHAIPDGLKEAARHYDFDAAGQFFATTFKGHNNPLEALAPLLSEYLAATGIHAGISLADDGDIHNPSGFSVRKADGRLRLNCVGFATLAHAVLKGLGKARGFQFSFVRISDQPEGTRIASANSNVISISPSQYFELALASRMYAPSSPPPENPDDLSGSSHLILVVTDGNGNNLVIDNHTTRYFEADDPWPVLKGEIYPSFASFASFYRGPDSSNITEKF